jgi:argininosuccinate lyase
MAKLWQKEHMMDKLIEEFSVGNDYILDRDLVKYDALGSIAHAAMLQKVGILSEDEFDSIKTTLIEIIQLDQEGKFDISLEDEDVHTKIENYLTEKLGDTGKKVHTARSRNDQVITAIRLYAKDMHLAIADALLSLCEALAGFAKKYEWTPMPGRTHTQRGMPSSMGLWAAAYAESLLDDLAILMQSYTLHDQSPLGSAASYGVPIEIDRELTAELMGFAKVQHNVLYANNSRGKFESVMIHSLCQIMLDLSKIASDVILFSLPELGYLTLPDEICSGSSIMPQKKNPAGMELLRAKAAGLIGLLVSVMGTIKSLPSGYNRDFQDTKGPTMQAIHITEISLRACELVIRKLQVNDQRCREACAPEIYAADEALRMSLKGIPFREAYREVAKNLEKLEGTDPVQAIKQRKHTGAPGNLQLERLAQTIRKAQKENRTRRETFERTLNKLAESVRKEST